MQAVAKTYSVDKANDLHPTKQRWFAVHTKYKAEKYVIAQLKKIGIEAYTPLLAVTKRYTRKVKSYEVPLINCYVFVKISSSDYIKVLETQHVFQFVKINKDLISIPEREIDLMKKVVGEYQEEISISNDLFVEGQAVEIIGGKLTGISGILINKNGKNDFLINLEKSGFQIHINIDPKLLRPLSLN